MASLQTTSARLGDGRGAHFVDRFKTPLSVGVLEGMAQVVPGKAARVQCLHILRRRDPHLPGFQVDPSFVSRAFVTRKYHPVSLPVRLALMHGVIMGWIEIEL